MIQFKAHLSAGFAILHGILMILGSRVTVVLAATLVLLGFAVGLAARSRRGAQQPIRTLVVLLVPLLTIGCLAWLAATGLVLGARAGLPPREIPAPATVLLWGFAARSDSAALQIFAGAARTALWGVAGAIAAGLLLAARVPLSGRKLHGEAHWAKPGEVRRAHLFGDKGIVIGRYRTRLLCFNGEERGKNVLIAAPPGSGKTAGIMLPNCLSWTQSLVALDIKGECYERSADFRLRLGQEVYRLDFYARNGRTDQYNPFAYVSQNPDLRVGDIEKIARYLCPNTGQGDPFWATSAREMFRALALYLYDNQASVTLGAIRDLLEVEDGLQAFARAVGKAAKKDPSTAPSARVLRDFATIGSRSENTHSGIFDQLMSALAPLANPLVRNATSGNSFDLAELRTKPISVYVIVARPDLPALRSILNLFIQQLVDLNTLVEYRRDPKHRCEVLLAMDEFTQVGRLDAIFEGITYFRSFGLRLLAIVQSPSQLKDVYSIDGAQTFEQSFDCRVYFTPAASDLDTAETLSRLLGYDTVTTQSRSRRRDPRSRSSTETTNERPRALLLPQEILRLQNWREIVLIGGTPPILARKIRVWQDRAFQQRQNPRSSR